jgi:phospholipid transport system transporter-binding protein
MPSQLHQLTSQHYQLSGDLDFKTVTALHEAVLPLFKDNSELTISLSEVGRADSAGVALLADWFRQANQHEINLRYLDIPPQMLSIVRVSGLDSILPLFRS